MSAEQAQVFPEIVAVLLIPVIVYIAGRLVEQALKAAYRSVKGELIFKEENQGDTSSLTIQTNSAIFLDDLTLHLEDRLIDVLSMIKDDLKIAQKKRIQFGPLDKIRFECILQKQGDKKLFINAYIGTDNAYFDEDLKVQYSNAKTFMEKTKMTIETSRKSYNRCLS